jgi:SAM-dependent methyltransferase
MPLALELFFNCSKQKMMYSPKDYWADLADQYDSDASGFAPILHPRAPSWFNDAIDNLQYHALRRALAIAGLSPGARLLDVGCGTGRWVRRYSELGFSPVGVDATMGMLRVARAHQTTCPLTVGVAHNLPFFDAVFDCVSDITVVQHIPYELQPKALQEMVRVLRPGGRMILLELIRGQDSHIFPRRPQGWICEVESCGATLLECFGQEFFLLDRLFVRLAHAVAGRQDNHTDKTQSASAASSSQKLSASRRVYWQLRRITVSFSAWTEPVIAKLCPLSTATHAVFVFRKNSK